MRDKGEMRQRRAGSDNLGAGDADAGIGLLGHMGVDVGWAARGAGSHVAVDRRLHDRVVDERHPLLAEAVPAARILVVGLVELGIGAESGEKRRLVVWRAAEPAISQPRPRGDRVASSYLFLGRTRRHEIAVSEAAPFGRAAQRILLLGVVAMQRVVKPRNHPRCIAKGRMLGDFFYALAIDPHLPAIVETVEKLLSRIGKRGHVRGSPCEALPTGYLMHLLRGGL